MVALRSARKGFWGFFGSKPTKPSARGNAVAFKAGAKAFKKSEGATPALQRVVMLSMQNEARSKN